MMHKYFQRAFLSVVLLYGLAGCATTGPDTSTAASLSGEMDIAATVAAHNLWRKEAGVPPLIWSVKLEKQAASWAEKLARKGCKLRHDRPGQNLFWITTGANRTFNISADAVVDYWASEKAWYNIKTNRCNAPAGKNCWHYTQLVWRDTRELGCAQRSCGEQAQVWVCNYSPAGNIFGRSPYQ